MKKNEQFNDQKDQIKEAFENSIRDFNVQSELKSNFFANLDEDIHDFGNQVYEDAWDKVIRKAILKFNDITNSYTITNGEEKVESWYDYVVFKSYGQTRQALFDVLEPITKVKNAYEGMSQPLNESGYSMVGLWFDKSITFNTLKEFGFDDDLFFYEEDGTLIVEVA